MKIATSRERLIQLLEMTGDSQADMVRKTGIEKSAISHYINGNREARQDKLIAIANAYKVNPAWLMGLDVPMQIEIDTVSDRDMAEALELYKRYVNAIPEIQDAVSRLLKSDE